MSLHTGGQDVQINSYSRVVISFRDSSNFFLTAIEFGYRRRPPPPPRLPPPLKPPPRDPRLEEPRLLLLRALERSYPRDPPPKASRFPPPLRERSRLPMRSAPPRLLPPPR